jgi:hypothetical protein
MMKVYSLVLTVAAALSLRLGFAQDPAQVSPSGPVMQDKYQLRLSRTQTPLQIDGELTEEVWQSAEAATDFWQKYPQDDQKAKKQTEVRVTYDDKFLYVGAILYDTSAYVIQTLKRDRRYFDSDGFAVVLDPVNERTNGFLFGVSPMNVQAEDLISPSTFGNLNFSWDNKWYSAVQRYPDRWTVEMAIPFKTLRFEPGKTRWGINFIRNDLKTNQYHTWTNVPVNFNHYDLGYTGALVWDAPPDRVNGNVSLIPYVTGSVMQDSERERPQTKGKLNGGFDAKVAVTSSLNLDLTVNPDFSQIEVDQQQTNLTRFNLFFPERRTFFLENGDLFSEFGTPPARPFFSRRIGLDQNGLPIPILFGARLSGNLDHNWRVGALNMQTRATDSYAAQNYSAVAINRRVLSRSLLKGYLTNRQGFLKGEGLNQNDFGRNAGLEFNFLNKKGTWNAWAGYHVSAKPNIHHDNAFSNVAVSYSGRNFSMFTDYFRMGTNYYADMGFINRIENYDAVRDTVIRLGYDHIYNEFGYVIRPDKSKSIIAHKFSLSTMLDFNPDGSLNERTNRLGYSIGFRNTSEFSLRLSDQDFRLLFPTRFTKEKPLPRDIYKFQQFIVEYESDARKPLAFETEIQIGEFYNGNLQRYILELTYRRQPWGNFSLGFEQNELSFPGEYGRASLSLIGQRSEINFSNSLFWTTFLQYNTQRNNFNINSRLQWRYKSMSDFYLVYTDNYFTDPFLKTKSRAIVFKLNYWLSI